MTRPKRLIIYGCTIVSSLVGLYYFGERSYQRSMERRGGPIVCRSNLKVLAEAKAIWAREHHKTTNDTPTWTDLLGTNGYILGGQPVCRSGGQYVFGRVGELPRCTIQQHNYQ